jgi:hypothetical protein
LTVSARNFRIYPRDGMAIIMCGMCCREYELARCPTLARVQAWALEHWEFVHATA